MPNLGTPQVRNVSTLKAALKRLNHANAREHFNMST